MSEAFRGSKGAGLYADVIHELDWSVGQILAALKHHGLDDNTLVIFTSDNGPWLAYGDHAGSALPFREGKGTTHEGGVREPFIARWPGRLPAGRVVDTPLMSIDLLPTIAGLANAPLPPLKIDGKPAWSVLTGESDQSPHEAYFFYYGNNELQGVRYQQWKLYFPHQYQSLQGQSGGTNGQPVGYQQARLPEIALYDVQRDPGETTNLAQQHPDVVARIQSLADTMRVDLGDSLTGTIGTGQRPIGKVTSAEKLPK